MTLDAYQYELPERCIAQVPAARRDESRLMVLDRAAATLRHDRFHRIGAYFRPGDVLVVNDARVIPARFFAHRKTGGRVEGFVLDGWQESDCRRVLLKPARRIRVGEILELADEYTMRIADRNGQTFIAEITPPGKWTPFLSAHGLMPLPPYIKRGDQDHRVSMDASMDRERYQTIYAQEPGAVAAPTAGLHFTHDLLQQLRDGGIETASITLWVGWGTFKPLTCQRIDHHVMEKEIYSISAKTAEILTRAKTENRRIIAVGTTTTRALESWANRDTDRGEVFQGEASLFIVPGYSFKMIDALVTNFHLPGSTLLMLVSALAGRETILDAYRAAVEHDYRFYSYGDAMLII
ncbi:tRNA preQ1(34) S-adenosylmethionine ribosyltransferase-isomerase QueA [bacterium]|nr:tRNA preQ1(34) S-adenosylmethionine ribosyltransferase-isomerase QueA [candidate division CSSED10-310 bacterium]